jgi:flagellin
MRINHNIQALNAYRNLAANQLSVSKNLERLSSGLRINRAADDAAGLAISEKMRSQIRGLEMAERNALDAISLIQTAEGALNEVHSILQRMRELAVQAANDTLEPSDRAAIQAEIDQLTKEIDRIADTTQFNQKLLFSGKAEGRPFATTNIPNVIQYDTSVPGSNTWKGVVYADPSFQGGFDLEIPSAIAQASAAELEGVKITINGRTYEFDTNSDGVTSGNIMINLNGLNTHQTADNAEVNRLNQIANAIQSAIQANDPDLVVNLQPAVGDSTDDGNVTNAILSIRTKDAASPADFQTGGKYENVAKVNITGGGGDASEFIFKDLEGTTFNPDGTNATAKFAKADSSQPAAVQISFAEMPKDGDQLQIDGYVFTFKDKPSSDAYSSGTTTYEISIRQDRQSMLNDIKTILRAGQLDNDTNLAALNSVDVIGTATLSLTTSKTNNGDTYQANGNAAGLEIKLVDNDFAQNAGAVLNLEMQIGANESETMKFDISVMDAVALGLAREADHQTPITQSGLNAVAGIDVTTAVAARAAITTVDEAIRKVSEERGKLGALQNRLEHTINNLKTANENLTSAESRIRDTDMAQEMAEFTKNNILTQAAQAMLAQSNQLPQGILQLLKS